MATDAVSAAKAAVRKLMADKDAIEREVDAIEARLNSGGANPPGLKGNLLDKEVGYATRFLSEACSP